MSLVESIVKNQKDELRKVHNTRFKRNGKEYRLMYDGGIAESVSIYSRETSEQRFKFEKSFPAYKMYSKEQAVAFAKNLISKT